MDSFYQEIIKSDAIVPSDPATRQPLHGADRGVGIRLEPGTPRSCYKCKWGTEDPTVPNRGQCVALKNKMGAIWRRYIPDYFNMTCDRFEEGEVDFREHV
jgi:benzylsuccinate synthase